LLALGRTVAWFREDEKNESLPVLETIPSQIFHAINALTDLDC